MRKPPVSELVDQDSLHFDYQGLPLLFYRAALPLPSRTLNYAAGIIRRHLKAIGSRWRKLNPRKQALLVLAHLRKGETFAQLVCFRPEAAERDAAVRARMIARLEEMIRESDQLSRDKRAELRGVI